jgi:hypothetical protein
MPFARPIATAFTLAWKEPSLPTMLMFIVASETSGASTECSA